jgi:undecaprenyl diphosphate synthase
VARKIDLIKLPLGTKVPDHVAIVNDGDRRWARAQGLSPSEGHRAGIENMVTMARTCRDWGVHTVSCWGLSTENWLERPKDEIDFLIKGIAMALDRYVDEMDKDGVKLVHLGRKDRLPEFLMDKINEVELRTRHNTKHIFNVALDYNGPDEIIRATQKMIKNGISETDVNKKTFEKYLDTAGQPYPYVDLFIRTSGEQRTSGFLMWQADYAEYYWETDHFPAFTPDKLRKAIIDYSYRRRRFGGNDAVEHMKFDPKIVARLELEWQRALNLGENARFRDLVVAYVKEQYGLSKELAVTAGIHMANALMYRKGADWVKAKQALKQLYGVVRKNIGLAMEPEIVADLQVKLWQKGGSESEYRQLYSETYRFSDLQAAKSAHLAYLANEEMTKNNFDKAKGYLEKFYTALKERVA